MIKADLPIIQGDDFTGIVSVTDSTNAPADLTGFAARAQIRRTVADSGPVEVELETEVIGSNVYLSIPHAQTELMTGKYVWDMQIVSATGLITTIIGGGVTVTAEVTRDDAAGVTYERTKRAGKVSR